MQRLNMIPLAMRNGVPGILELQTQMIDPEDLSSVIRVMSMSPEMHSHQDFDLRSVRMPNARDLETNVDAR